MLKNKLLVVALASSFALPALADTAPASPFSSNVSLTTNYLYRGISQTGGKPAVQGGFDYAGASGLYIGAWGSNISWISDGAVASMPAWNWTPMVDTGALRVQYLMTSASCVTTIRALTLQARPKLTPMKSMVQ